jgi:hypothetical protein
VPHHVVLCDNGCDEGTVQHGRAEYPDIDVIRLERNPGLSTAGDVIASTKPVTTTGRHPGPHV